MEWTRFRWPAAGRSASVCVRTRRGNMRRGGCLSSATCANSTSQVCHTLLIHSLNLPTVPPQPARWHPLARSIVGLCSWLAVRVEGARSLQLSPPPPPHHLLTYLPTYLPTRLPADLPTYLLPTPTDPAAATPLIPRAADGTLLPVGTMISARHTLTHSQHSHTHTLTLLLLLTEDALLPVGTTITARHFVPGQKVDVQVHVWMA